MKKLLMAFAAALCAGALFAQAPAEKAKPAPEKKTAAAPEKKAPAPAVKPAEDQEESVVMIDSRSDPDDVRASAADAEDRALPGGLPSSYGQCRGVISEAGRSVLVFESQDDGSIAFVQVVLGKTGVTWKLLDRVYRSAD
jgi:hypothetical protein